jgi:hypothetical protein
LRRITSRSRFVSLGNSSRMSDVLMLGTITVCGIFVSKEMPFYRSLRKLNPVLRKMLVLRDGFRQLEPPHDFK